MDGDHAGLIRLADRVAVKSRAPQRESRVRRRFQFDPGVVMACDSRRSSYSTQSRSILMGFARGGSNPPLVRSDPAAYMDSEPALCFLGRASLRLRATLLPCCPG